VTARDRLVDAALALGRQHGFHGTRMQDILELAQARPGSAYHHFPGGKEEIVAAAMAEAGRRIDVLLEALVTGALTVSEAFAALTDATLEQLVASDWADGCPVGTPASDGLNSPSVLEAAATAFETWRATLSTALRAEGHPDPDTTALALLALYEGALLLARATRSPDPLQASSSAAEALIVT
jgi:TetR/AcrR family transcriptional regulator, lmrAB and yxaGH operons repressor